MENIKNIGTSEIYKLSSEQKDNTQVEKIIKLNGIKLSFTSREFEKFAQAINIFNNISQDDKFFAAVREIVGQETDIKDIKDNLIDPISNSIQKIKISKRSNSSTSSTSFFVKKMESTIESKLLYERVSDALDNSLKFDQHEYSCISDVRSMITLYCNIYGRKPDIFLNGIAPNTFRDLDIIPKGDKSIAITAAKEILKWVPKS